MKTIKTHENKKKCKRQTTQKGFDALGDVLKPAGAHQNQQQASAQPNIAGGVPGAGTAGPQPAATGKLLTGDLDSSLASLADNLTINKG